MIAFENARKFFDACESSSGWAGCKQYVEKDASFEAQVESMAEVKTVEVYCEQMAAFGRVTAPGSTYDLHASGYDEETRTALFFATYHATHTGEGGPVPPTYKQTHTQYVYILTMSEDNQVERMIKVWNASWTQRELGWI